VQAMQEGQTIKHDVYGLGIVTASDMERTSVDFDDHGPKLFVTSIMTAELIGEAPALPRPSAAAKPPQQQKPPRKPQRPPPPPTLNFIVEFFRVSVFRTPSNEGVFYFRQLS